MHSLQAEIDAPNHAMSAPIGVFDSGIGGLSILRALRAELPAEDFIYIADSGHAPYGERDEAHVLARSRAVARHLIGQDVKALVIACNTATAAAISCLRAEFSALPMVGVEPALKPAVALSRGGRIGIMATRATLASAKFQALLASQAGLAQFVLQPCDGLADAIESSAVTLDATELIAICDRFMRAMGRFGIKKGDIDTLVLGCTHYPLADTHLRRLLGPLVQIVENGEAVAQQTRRMLNDCVANTEEGRVTLCTTGQPAVLEAAARRWLQLDLRAKMLSIR